MDTLAWSGHIPYLGAENMDLKAQGINGDALLTRRHLQQKPPGSSSHGRASDEAWNTGAD